MLSPRRAAALACLAPALVLSGCGGEDDPEPRQAADSISSTPPVAPSATSAPTSPAATPAASTPATSAPASSAAPQATELSTATPDGTTYAFLIALDGDGAGGADLTMRYDKMDYRQAECEALEQPANPMTAFEVCFSNVNPLIREVPVASDVTIIGADEDGPGLELTPDEFRDFLISADNPYGPEGTALELTVTGGKVTRIEQFVLSSA